MNNPFFRGLPVGRVNDRSFLPNEQYDFSTYILQISVSIIQYIPSTGDFQITWSTEESISTKTYVQRSPESSNIAPNKQVKNIPCSDFCNIFRCNNVSVIKSF